jgi:4-hydroxybenzoate polyprenyltransferase
LALIPAAVLAGAALSVGNALVDVERDAAAGRRGSAVVLGPRTGWVVQTVCLFIVVVLAFVLAPEAPTGAADVLAIGRSAGVPLGSIAIALGAVALLTSAPGTRERGWELEAVGVAMAGIAWLAGVAASA